MQKWQRWLAVLVTLILATTTFYLSPNHQESAPATNTHQAGDKPELTRQLPLMMELGSTTCVPCQMMEKVLESLHQVIRSNFRLSLRMSHSSRKSAVSTISS